MKQKRPNLQPGDRVAYSAKFLKNTGQFTGPAGSRRGTLVTWDSIMPGGCRVRWDDQEACMLARKGGFEEDDYCADVIEHGGTLANAHNLAKVGSARFACNDLSG